MENCIKHAPACHYLFKVLLIQITLLVKLLLSICAVKHGVGGTYVAVCQSISKMKQAPEGIPGYFNNASVSSKARSKS